jgi:hypothetical protein
MGFLASGIAPDDYAFITVFLCPFFSTGYQSPSDAFSSFLFINNNSANLRNGPSDKQKPGKDMYPACDGAAVGYSNKDGMLRIRINTAVYPFSA